MSDNKTTEAEKTANKLLLLLRQNCKKRHGRWTGKELKEGEVECKFGDGDPYVPVDCPDCDGQRNPKYDTCFDCFTSSK